MEDIPQHNYLKYPPNIKIRVLRLYDLDKEERRNEALELIEEWLKKQSHFVKRDFSRHYLESSLVTCKGSIEKVKKQLESLCTMKTVAPWLFTKTNVKEELKHLYLFTCVLLPRQTQDDHRVMLIRANKGEVHSDQYVACYHYGIILCEYLKCHEYSKGYIVAVDFRNANIVHMMSKLNAIELQQCMTTVIDGYGARLKKILFITESKAIELFIQLIKQFLSPKIGGRIQTINRIEDLVDYLPVDILPEDYGGTEKPTDTLYGEWVDALSTEDHVSYMEMMNKACTDESLRQIGQFNEDYMGMPGSFRHLSVD